MNDRNTAIVTGGSRGIGAAIAKKLGSQGINICIVYHKNHEAARAVVDEIVRGGGFAECFCADLGNESEVKKVTLQIGEKFGIVDILVNAAGVFESATLADSSQEKINRLFSLNVLSVINMVRYSLKYFPAAGGKIINLSSNLIYSPRVGTGIYAASKAAVSVLTNAYAKELAPSGITVNAVAPSMTNTDMTSGTSEARRRQVIENTPLARIGEPEDIASVVAFLASQEAAWITGRTLLVDGGMTDAL